MPNSRRPPLLLHDYQWPSYIKAIFSKLSAALPLLPASSYLIEAPLRFRWMKVFIDLVFFTVVMPFNKLTHFFVSLHQSTVMWCFFYILQIMPPKKVLTGTTERTVHGSCQAEWNCQRNSYTPAAGQQTAVAVGRWNQTTEEIRTQ